MEKHLTATALIVDGDRVLLHWHHRLGQWMPPGGHVEPEEDPVEALLREVREETGVMAQVVHQGERFPFDYPRQLPLPFMLLVECSAEGGEPHEHLDLIYLCRVVGDPTPRPPGGDQTVRWVSAAELRGDGALARPDGVAAPVAPDVRALALRALALQPQGAYFQALPIHIDDELTVEQLIAGLSPWGSVTLQGLKGTPTGRSGTPHIYFNYEWPTPYLLALEPVSKEAREHLHLSRYCTDVLIATGSLPYSQFARGNDPPDFLCRADDIPIGLDCTQFTIPSRRTANGLFEAIRDQVLREPRGLFTTLRGCTVYMWFGSPTDQNALPYKAQDQAAIRELVAALAAVAVDLKRLRLPTAELPGQAPDLDLKHTAHGCTFYVVPMVDIPSGSLFFASTGFEIGFAYTTKHDRDEGWAEVKRLVKQHDKPGVDHLLITVGGPNERGLAFLSEEAFMDFMLQQRVTIEAPQHLSRVTVHMWSTARIVELLPNARQ